MVRTVLTELLGIIDKLVHLDDRRIVLVFLVAVEPRQDDPDRFFVGRLKTAKNAKAQRNRITVALPID
jgi:hypothetical protein